MNEEKTTLQKILEQKAEQMRNAIEQAIDEGAKIEKLNSVTSLLKCCVIGGLYLQKDTTDNSIFILLRFRSEKIAKAFEPSKDELEKMAEQKRAELEELEKQINAKQ